MDNKDCEHLFFECLRAQAVWASQNVPCANVMSKEAFWEQYAMAGPWDGAGKDVCSSLGHLAKPQ